jgi:starch synthase
VRDLSGKVACKRALLEEMGLPAEAMTRPLFGIVSRFTGQKGTELVAAVAAHIAAEDAYLVALGSGETDLQEAFVAVQREFPERVAVRIGFDDGLAHRIEAGSDLFLMPSRYEPCGLNQIYSLRYGTVPVVRATGGLDDTIEEGTGKEGTGFKFSAYSPEALLGAVKTAIAAYGQSSSWQERMRRGMEKDFSWSASAAAYSLLYRQLLGR